MKRIMFVLLLLSLAFPAFAADQMPGKGVTVQPARATWNTGLFPGSPGACRPERTGLRRKEP